MPEKEIDLSKLANVFLDSSKKIDEVAEQVLNVISEDILNQSVKLAPLDEGGLRESGSVTPAKKEGNEIAAYVGYSKEYALKMHEDVYTPSTPGTGRKYLEKPIKQNAQKYADYFAEKIGDVFDE